MDAYDPEPWHDLFVMSGGAAAALAGLIFVAVSLNFEQILPSRSRPGLAMRTLAVLVGLVLTSALALSPIPRTGFGVAVLVLGVAMTAAVLAMTIPGVKDLEHARYRLVNIGLALATSLPLVVGGISLLAGAGGGLLWLLAEVIVGFVVSSYNAWVLLVEIRR